MNNDLVTETAYVLIQGPFHTIQEIEDDFLKIRITASKIDVGDEYHKLSELYEMRLALSVALFKAFDSYITPLNSRVRCWKSKLHSDGTMFEGYFIVGMAINSLSGGMELISFHYKMEHWSKFKVMELSKAPLYDGHTSKDVIERLMSL